MPSCTHFTKLGNRRSFVNRNYPRSVGGSVRVSATDSVSDRQTGNGMKAAFLAVAVLAAAGVVFHFSANSSPYLSTASASRVSESIPVDWALPGLRLAAQ